MNAKEINSLNRNSKKDKYCLNCKKIYFETYCSNCPQCRQKLIDKEDIPISPTSQAQNIPRCPTCQSQNISKISNAKRITHGVAFGLLSRTAFSQYECKNCGYKW